LKQEGEKAAAKREAAHFGKFGVCGERVNQGSDDADKKRQVDDHGLPPSGNDAAGCRLTIEPFQAQTSRRKLPDDLIVRPDHHGIDRKVGIAGARPAEECQIHDGKPLRVNVGHFLDDAADGRFAAGRARWDLIRARLFVR
jgi:hypothetical protein